MEIKVEHQEGLVSLLAALRVPHALLMFRVPHALLILQVPHTVLMLQVPSQLRVVVPLHLLLLLLLLVEPPMIQTVTLILPKDVREHHENFLMLLLSGTQDYRKFLCSWSAYMLLKPTQFGISSTSHGLCEMCTYASPRRLTFYIHSVQLRGCYAFRCIPPFCRPRLG